MLIHCNDREDFLETIDGLVRRGLTFKADGSTLEITLLGGF